MDLIVQCVLVLNFFIIIIISQSFALLSHSGGGSCWIYNTTIGASFKLTESCENINFHYVTFPEPSLQLFESLAAGRDSLRVVDSYADSVYLPYSLRQFHLVGAQGCTTQIVIHENGSYKLERILLDALPQLPGNICKLRHLKVFDCSRVHGGTIDFSLFANMTQLEEFMVLDTTGITVSKPLELPFLRKLVIRDSPITIFNDTYYSFRSLNSLFLENNSLVEIPEHFSSFSNLTSFYLINNPLRHVTLNIFATMNQLEVLDLTGNQISAITVHNRAVLLPRLQKLFLGNNALTELNVTMWVMPALDSLTLNNNRLKQVPGLLELFVANVKSLEMLDNPWERDWITEIAQRIPGMHTSYANLQ